MWSKLKESRAFYIAVSILGAMIFWLYVDVAQPTEASVPIRGIPVTFVGTEHLDEEGLLILNEAPTIDIQVSGPRSAITRLNQNNVTITASAGEITSAGVYSLDVVINLPSSVTSSTSQPVRTTYRSASAVDVTVVQMVSKTVEIVPEFTGTVAANRFYDDNSFVLQQHQLMVSGEESEVNAVSFARVTLDENNLSSTWTGWLDIVLCDKEGKPVETENLTLETDSISVAFYVDCEKEVPLTVTLLPGAGAAAEDAEYHVTPPTIKVTGQEIQLDDLERIDLGTVDLSKIITTESYDFDIQLPSGISAQNKELKTAHVEVSISDLDTRKITTTNIQLENAPEGHIYQPQALEVRIRGKADAFDLFMSDDIKVIADLDGMDVKDGSTVTVPAKVEIEGISELGVLGSYNVEIAVSSPNLPEPDSKDAQGSVQASEG